MSSIMSFVVGEKINITTAFNKHRDMDVQGALNLLRMNGWAFYSWGAHSFTAIGKKALRLTKRPYN